MALIDVWMLTLVQAYGPGGERMQNNFFYTSLDVGANAEALFDAFTVEDGMLEDINGIQSDYISNVSIRVINLGSLTDFYENAVTGNGLDANGTPMPMHDAINFTLKLSTRAVRSGSKRIGGLDEHMQNAGVINDAPTIALIGALEFELANAITDGTSTFVPIVVKRILRPPDEDHENERYTLPETDGELVFGNVVAALVNLHVSHQVSRGNGR